jgi:sarcosine oxidase
MGDLDTDVVVVGLGAIGSAAAYWLARAGADVVGIEQFELGHHNGASHDHSRIIRRSYHTPGYVELTGHAYDAWADLEADVGEQLVFRTGGLDLWPPDAAIPMTDYTESLAAQRVPFDTLDRNDVQREWPQWHLPEGTVALHQADTGIVAAESATAALRVGARSHGARLVESTPVTGVRAEGDHYTVDTAAGPVRARRVVLACDAWTNELLAGFDAQLPLVVTLEQLTYLRADPIWFGSNRFPVWIWMDEPSWYGFPEFGKRGWAKVAQDCGGAETSARTRSFDPDPDAEARLLAFLAARLPGLITKSARSSTCLYTLTPDRDFVLDTLPDHPGVSVALGAAHGFKFAALFGKILRDLALDVAPPFDLEPFRIDRPALTDPDAPRHWLV